MYLTILLIIGLLLMVLTYSAGNFIALFFQYKNSVENKSIIKIFFSYLIGASAIIVFYSIAKTHLISINIVFLFFLISGIWYLKILSRKKIIFSRQKIFRLFTEKEFLLSLLIFIVSFFYWSIFFFDYHNDIVKLAWTDYHFPADLSKGLINTGIENTLSGLYQHYPVNGFQLYHFFDIWLNSFVSDFFKINAIDSLLMLVFPFFFFLIILGIRCVLVNFIKNPLLILVLSLLIPASINTVYPPFKIDFFYWNTNLLAHPAYHIGLKILPIYVFFITSVLLIIRYKDLPTAILVLLSICYIYSTTIIPILFGLSGSLLIAFLFIKKNNIDRSLIFKMLCLTFFSGILIFFFEKIFSSPDVLYKFQNFNHFSIKRAFWFIGEISVKTILAYFFPVMTCIISIVFIIRKKVNSINLFYFVILLFIGLTALLFANIFYFITDFSQIYTNIIPGILISIFLFSLFLFSVIHKYLLRSFILLAIIFGIIGYINSLWVVLSKPQTEDVYSTKFIQSVVCEIDNSKNHKVIIWLKENNEPNIWYLPSSGFAKIISKTKTISQTYDISENIKYGAMPCIPYNPGLKKQHFIPTPYELWAKKNLIELLPYDYNILLRYFKDIKLTHLLIEKGVLIPEKINNHFKLVLQDINSGAQLYRII